MVKRADLDIIDMAFSTPSEETVAAHSEMLKWRSEMPKEWYGNSKMDAVLAALEKAYPELKPKPKNSVAIFKLPKFPVCLCIVKSNETGTTIAGWSEDGGRTFGPELPDSELVYKFIFDWAQAEQSVIVRNNHG